MEMGVHIFSIIATKKKGGGNILEKLRVCTKERDFLRSHKLYSVRGLIQILYRTCCSNIMYYVYTALLLNKQNCVHARTLLPPHGTAVCEFLFFNIKFAQVIRKIAFEHTIKYIIYCTQPYYSCTNITLTKPNY